MFARLMAMKSDPRSTSNQKALWEFSESLLPRKRCGDFNQSLMELGSELCHPKRPQCLVCPIRSLCPTAIQGLQQQIPVAAQKVKYEEINEAVIIVRRNNKYLVRKCGPGERWEGLWDFPRYARDDGDGLLELATKLEQQTGLTTTLQPTQQRIKHAVTKFRITLDCFETESTSGRLTKNGSTLKWISLVELGNTPMSVTGRKIALTLDKGR